MARYSFQARAINGQVQSGQIEAANESEVQAKLKSRRMTALRIVKAEGATSRPAKTAQPTGIFGHKVDSKEMQIFTRQFATLINAGIPIVDSLKILSEGKRNFLKDTIAIVKDSIEQGKRLGDSMAAHPKVFNRFFVNMVRAGEEAGILDTILTRLASYMEKSEKLKKQIKGAMVYPASIIFVAIAVVTGILVFIIPKFQELYASGGKELPAVTQIVVGMSKFCQQKWYVLVAIVFLLPYMLAQYYATDEGRSTMDRIFIKMPAFGELIQKSSIARMTRTLSTLLSSGVSVVDALDIASKTAGNIVIEEALNRSKDAVISGKPLTAPLAKEKMIPEMVTQMIAIGESSGTMDQMLGKIADFYEDDVENAVKAFTSLIEPAMMVILGGIIAFLVVAMYLPIFDLAGVASGQ